ncbi:MAG: hypothetical protein J6C64_03280 [Lachnospiraceae bacterium]|nr:hypothetical protein [Lachnospiraceae bacterium]
MEKKYSKMQLEDKALKSAAMYFGQELLPYLKVEGRILRLLPTEQIRLEAVKADEDILFEMEDGTLAHFEFESVEISKEDLYRFRMYDAYTAMQYKKPVITYVICSGRIGRIHSKLKEGLNPYQIIPLRMKQENADVLIQELEGRVKRGEILPKEDLVPLLLTPLMSGESAIKDRLLITDRLLNSDRVKLKKEEKYKMEGVLYAFACKFLAKGDLDEIKETLSMTVLGEMIWNDGLEKGLEKGKSFSLINLVCRKLQKGKTSEQIAEDLDEDLSVVMPICEAARQCAPEYDSEKIYNLLKGN